MKLFVIKQSPNARKVLSVASHIGLNPEVIEMDFTNGSMQTPEFLAVNPYGKIPALKDGDFTLWESNAICQYLGDVSGSDMVGKDAKERAEILKWLCFEECHFGKSIHGIMFEKMVKPMFNLGEPSSQIIEHNLNEFNRAAKVMDDHLQDKKYLVSDRLTIADFTLGAFLGFHEKVEISLAEFKNIEAWYRNLNEFPAWESTKPQF